MESNLAVTWLKLETWIGIDTERTVDEDGALDPTLTRRLQEALAEVDGVILVDGMAAFAETAGSKAPINGGSY